MAPFPSSNIFKAFMLQKHTSWAWCFGFSQTSSKTSSSIVLNVFRSFYLNRCFFVVANFWYVSVSTGKINQVIWIELNVIRSSAVAPFDIGMERKPFKFQFSNLTSQPVGNHHVTKCRGGPQLWQDHHLGTWKCNILEIYDKYMANVKDVCWYKYKMHHTKNEM